MNHSHTDNSPAFSEIQKTYALNCREVAKDWLELADRLHDPQMRRFALDRAIDNYNTAQALEAA